MGNDNGGETLTAVAAFIRKRVGNKEDAEDILQTVWYQPTRAADGSFTPINQLSGWLYRVARNLIINNSKKKCETELPQRYVDELDEDSLRDIQDTLLGSEEPQTPETKYLCSLIWTELRDVLAELPPEQREMFELTELEGFL